MLRELQVLATEKTEQEKAVDGETTSNESEIDQYA